MIVNILVILALVAIWLYSMKLIFPSKPTPKKKVTVKPEVTAVDKDEKTPKKPRRICKGWSNHGMLGRR